MPLTFLTLFAWSFAAATILPVGSEPLLIKIVRDSGLLTASVLIATAGNYLGSLTTWWLGRKIEDIAHFEQRGRYAARAAAWMQRYGAPSLLLSWVPFIGDLLVLFAGATRMKAGPFSFWVILGKGGRYLAVALAVRYLL